MKYRKFGSTNWDVSEIGFGAWAIGGAHWGKQSDEESIKALHKALDLGLNFIDTAQGYGNGHSEELIARVLSERGEKPGGGKIRVATKIPPKAGNWPPFPDDRCPERFPEDYLRDRLEFSLKKLKTDTIDILQLHTWTRAWNDAPSALEILHKFKKEGKILAVGISTPEHDQDSVNDLMRAGLLDSVQVIYNIFEQEPAAQLLPLAEKYGVGIIVRVVFDEGALTGKFTAETQFPAGDFRRNYFKGSRLAETVNRVEKVKKTLAKFNVPATALPSVALRFVLRQHAVSTVIPGIRSIKQAEMNCAASDEVPIPDNLYASLKKFNWRRAFWHE
jgi:aryl-alcohol dehydrogenase-like predicted oxidoreductase